MSYRKFNHAVEEIRDDRRRGASEMARRCLAILIEAAQSLPVMEAGEFRAMLLALAHELVLTRPSMTAVSTLLHHWQTQWVINDDMTLDAIRTSAVEQASILIEASRQALTACTVCAARYVGMNRTVMTHSLSSTVVEVCRLLKDQGLRMIVTESRPLEEGQRLAEQLSAWQIPTLYITDAQIGLFVGQADCVLVGADSLLADGTVVNKAGSYLLALAAREQDVPFYVCCESFKRRDADAPPLKLEEMAATELGTPQWPGVMVRNIYFDLTPASLVSAWIDETGLQVNTEYKQRKKPDPCILKDQVQW
ncbi:MAG: hypothetical protein CSA09_03685 [Candidatus Contendobacter odensis]|uniref:Initiation factor 2B n=1 Tax=Candidatus Contendibacter odensensis TaxID=1400860 RepID=A0A2G6PF51_9GAMM|nr:MAG: hypothetical protein CSA09_03685 [Candidatus Contendobacter odensis]